MKRSVCIAAGLVLALVSGPAFASFAVTAPSSMNSFSTATLEAPAAISVEAVCRSGSVDVDVTWTRSASSFADGYDLLRSDHDGGATITAIAGGDTVEAVDPSVGAGKTFDYWVRSTSENWESAWSEMETVTTPASCP